MAAHVRQERRRRQILMRRPRVFKDRSNPLEDLDEGEVFRRYRFKPPTIIYILEQIIPVTLQRPTQRNSPLPPLLQLLLCLRFLATGSMHLLIGDSLNLSRTTAGRCIRDVAERISRLASQHIKFPAGRAADDVKTAFSRISAAGKNVWSLKSILTNAAPLTKKAMPIVDQNVVDSKAGTDFVEGPSDVDCQEDDYLRQRKLKREDNRLETFKDWPTSIPVTKEELAKDGFYYMNTGDKVKCVFCNLVLKNWELGDSARTEHTRFNPTCPFLRNRQCGNIPIIEDHPAPMVVGLKYPEYSSREVRLASFANWPKHLKQSPRLLSEAGLFYTGNQDAVACFFCGGTLRNWEPQDDPWSEHRHWFPFCEFLKTQPPRESKPKITDVMRQCIDMGYDEEVVQAAVERKRLSGADDYEFLNDLIDELENIKLRQQMSPARSKTPVEPHAAAGPSVTHGTKNTGASSSIEEEYKTLKEEKLCKICMEREVEVTFLPCGHLVSCNKCAQTLKDCPICRKRIRAFVKTYMS